MQDHERAERAIISALRSCIREHGAIRADLLTSAAKRIRGQVERYLLPEYRRPRR